MNGNGKGKLVLVVEDSPTQSIRMQNLLETNGLRCLLAPDGQTGLDLARANLPDVVVLDLEMPNMNGFQVCQQLKGHPQTAKIPVILLTRHDEAEVVMLGLELGAVEFIPKDVFADIVLIETLRQMNMVETQEPDGPAQ